MRGEPTAIVARPVSILRIGPHLPEGNRQPAKVVDDRLDARMTLDSTNIPQMSLWAPPNRMRPWPDTSRVTNSGAKKVTFTGEVNKFGPNDGRLPIVEGRQNPIGPPDTRPLEHHPDCCFRYVQYPANRDVGIPLGQGSQHLRCGSERLVIVQRYPVARLGSCRVRWNLGCTILDSQQRSNRCRPRPSVSQWIEIGSVIFDVTWPIRARIRPSQELLPRKTVILES